MQKKRIAVFTIIQNGGDFLKIWYKYYSKFVPPQDIYILDCESTDNVLTNLNCNVVSLEGYSITNVPALNIKVNRFKAKLLKEYELVMFSDYDEILYHPNGFDHFIDNPSKRDYFTATGYEIVQNTEVNENKINFHMPILSQRKYWYKFPALNKTLIIRKENVTWGLGNHIIFKEKAIPVDRYFPRIIRAHKTVYTRHNQKPNPVPDLYLIHLHKVDRDYCYQKNQRNVNEGKTPVVGGHHNFYLGRQFDEWWETAEEQLVEIPENIIQACFV